MAEPYVRHVGRIKDIHKTTVDIGIDHDAVTVAVGITQATLPGPQAEEFARLFVSACWQAAEQAGRMRDDD
jgi:hypothetical protein